MTDVQQTVRHCLQAFQRLVGRRDDAHARVAAFLAAIDELARLGCETEAMLVRELRDKLSGIDELGTDLARHMDGAIERLERIPWQVPPRAGDAETRAPLRIHFVRHAESTGNQDRRLQGSRIGGALTPLGQAQSKRTAAYLLEQFPDRRTEDILLVSSPVERALETARPIEASLGCPLLTEPDLSEVDMGDWTGRYFSDLESDKAYQDWMGDKWFNAPPAGESLFEVRTRACRAVSSLCARAILENRPLVVVTHYFPLIAVFSTLIPGQAVSPDNASISVFEVDAGRWSAQAINYILHLGSDSPVPVGYV